MVTVRISAVLLDMLTAGSSRSVNRSLVTCFCSYTYKKDGPTPIQWSSQLQFAMYDVYPGILPVKSEAGREFSTNKLTLYTRVFLSRKNAKKMYLSAPVLIGFEGNILTDGYLSKRRVSLVSM